MKPPSNCLIRSFFPAAIRTVLILVAVFSFESCSSPNRHVPSIDVFGSYFPAWLISLAAGIVLSQLTLRLAVVCTLMVLVTYTFRMPYQDLMPFLILFITKEDKVSTVLSALLCLLGITLAVAAAIVIYKCTGNRAEFRIPGIAAEIFVGMYLFRVLSIGPVGWILAFVVSASQSLVYLVPSAEETVHLFLWLWVAIAFSVGLAWIANLLLFPVSAIHRRHGV